MKGWMLLASAAVCACASGCVYVPGDDGPRHRLALRVLSSAPEHVTGGDARIEVKAAPELHDRVTFWLNDTQIAPLMARDGRRMEGVVSGMAVGPNRLEVRHPDGAADALTLTNYPVTGPIFSGPQQQPFVCRTQEAGFGQPHIDNHEGIGHPVFGADDQVAGHSKYCSIATSIAYFYFTGSTFKPFDPETGYSTPPPDLARTPVNGTPAPFVVRVEVGTINRFLYTIATLAPFATPAGGPRQFDRSVWNEKLVYWLRGGTSIGHQQGKALWFNEGMNSGERLLLPRILAQGYAIATSSGNETGVHYNLRLAEETALMTKERFIEAYGKPEFTIGLGGSGGGVQQYLFAQNRPDLLDGGIPIQSYPDMVTQTIPVSDCPLLGQYFKEEVERNPASFWATWSNQRLIEGVNASDTVRNPVTGGVGSTECINGWRTAMPVVLNPIHKDPEYEQRATQYRYPADAFANVKWTHWNDLENVYGTDRDGYAPISIDNVGVQYGLGALTKGDIGADEFLRINACVGGWKEQRDFVAWDAAADPHDARNMRRSATCRDVVGIPAPRRAGDLGAMRTAVSSGHVFTGRRLTIPMIDLRPYLEPELNMHNSRQALSVRARLHDGGGLAANQVIWFTGSNANLGESAVNALKVMDLYLSSGTAPAGFVDQCVDAAGAAIGAGTGVWDGILDAKPPGACTRAYPIFSSSRMVAGDSIKGDRFKCALKPVAVALADGTYPASAQFTELQKAWLTRIFPDGVCDYSRPGPGA